MSGLAVALLVVVWIAQVVLAVGLFLLHRQMTANRLLVEANRAKFVSESDRLMVQLNDARLQLKAALNIEGPA